MVLNNGLSDELSQLLAFFFFLCSTFDFGSFKRHDTTPPHPFFPMWSTCGFFSREEDVVAILVALDMMKYKILQTPLDFAHNLYIRELDIY